MSVSFELNSPLWLLGLPVLIGLVWWAQRLRWRFTYIPIQPGSIKPWQSRITLWTTGLSGACILLALSEPTLIYPTTCPVLPSVWVLWDVSHSMRNTDLLPDRRRYALALWEKALDTLVEHQARAKLGLLAFAQGAYGILPLTSDLETFRWALRQVILLDIGEGTDLGEALEVALSHSEPGMHLLIVSDGAHNNPLSADLRRLAQIAHDRGISIHALWVGQDSASTFSQSLRLLANQTNGRFWANALQLRPLYRFETLPTATPLQKPLLWAALLATLLMGAALCLGWFNILSA